MERKIGEIFEYNGEWYQCIVGNDCENCAFNERKCYTVVDNGDTIGDCCADRRKDNKDVIFKKLEKVGNPYEYMDKFYQKYRLFPPINETINLEIKQKQEDMEENKLNLEPFDIQKAREGNPVCTRDGRKVRIICFDLKGDMCPIVAAVEENNMEVLYHYDTRGLNCYKKSEIDLMMFSEKKKDMEEKKSNLKPFNLEAAKAGKPVCTRDGRKARIISCSLMNKNFPIAAIVEGEEENVYQFEANGVCDEHDENLDLMMLPEKKEGYVNLYHNCNDRYAAYLGNNVIYKDKEFAEDMGRGDINYIKTVKVQWEE